MIWWLDDVAIFWGWRFDDLGGNHKPNNNDKNNLERDTDTMMTRPVEVRRVHIIHCHIFWGWQSDKIFPHPLQYHLKSFAIPLTIAVILSRWNNPGGAQSTFINYSTNDMLDNVWDSMLVICYPLMGNASFEAWWGDLLGPGKVFNTDQYFIVCCNINCGVVMAVLAYWIDVPFSSGEQKLVAPLICNTWCECKN